MLRRLGCACCETEESYNLDTSPVYEKREKNPEPASEFADNKAFNVDHRTPDNPNTSVEKQGDNGHSETAAESEVKPTTFPNNQTVLEDFKLAQLTAVSQTAIPEIVINESSINDGDGDCEVSISTSPIVLQTGCEEGSSELESSDQEEITTKMADNVIPKITQPAPEFRGQAVVNGAFKEISLSDYKGKYVVFFFYPLDFTFVCPTEIIAFSDRAEEFRKIGCEVVACSTDSHFCHLAWVNTPRKQGGLGEMDIPLLSDKNCAIAKSYGVYKEDEGVTFRGLFIIDDKGNLRQVTVNDLPVGRSVDETIRLVQAFQFTDKHGEVCPAGWKPGQKTMKADPTGSKEYFASKN